MEIDRISAEVGKLVKEGSKSSLVDLYSREIRLEGGCFLTELLFRTANKIHYKEEPKGRDEWQKAEYTLVKCEGDCEDYTILIGATLLCAGYPVLLKFTASQNEFDHVYPISWDGETWVALDATLKTIGLDFEESYAKEAIYTLEGVAVKVGDLSPFTWLGWLALAAVVVILLLKAMIGG